MTSNPQSHCWNTAPLDTPGHLLIWGLWNPVGTIQLSGWEVKLQFDSLMTQPAWLTHSKHSLPQHHRNVPGKGPRGKKAAGSCPSFPEDTKSCQQVARREASKGGMDRKKQKCKQNGEENLGQHSFPFTEAQCYGFILFFFF